MDTDYLLEVRDEFMSVCDDSPETNPLDEIEAFVNAEVAAFESRIRAVLDEAAWKIIKEREAE